jgi:hypothetical protein
MNTWPCATTPTVVNLHTHACQLCPHVSPPTHPSTPLIHMPDAPCAQHMPVALAAKRKPPARNNGARQAPRPRAAGAASAAAAPAGRQKGKGGDVESHAPGGEDRWSPWDVEDLEAVDLDEVDGGVQESMDPPPAF